MDDHPHLPDMTFRDEVINALRLIEQTPEPGEYPAWPPRDILAMLAVTGPPLGDEALPLLQMVLDDLYERGEVGRVPAPTRHHAARYCTREAVEAAIRFGAPIILKPLAHGSEPTRQSP